MEFGKLVQINIRELWPHEERDFTPWLSDNLPELAKILGLDLELVGREVDVGGFFLDVLARETGTGRLVVIENQFGASDHDHLGKLLTYAGGKQAGVLVWIAERVRDEHRQAIEWLNDHTNDETIAFALEMTAFRIDTSKPVFQFKTVVEPNDWAKAQKTTTQQRQVTNRDQAYQAFFQILLDELREKHRFTNARLGQPQSWYSFASGFRGMKYGASFAGDHRICTEIYFDTGDKEENKARFDCLFARRDELDRNFGSPLVWERLDSRQACRICVRETGVIADSPEKLLEYRGWMVSNLLRLKDLWRTTMQPFVEQADRDRVAIDL